MNSSPSWSFRTTSPGGMHINQKGLHVAGGLVRGQGVEVQCAALARRIVAGEMNRGAQVVPADDGRPVKRLVVQQRAQPDAETPRQPEQGGQGRHQVAGFERRDHFGAAAALLRQGFDGELAPFAELAEARADEIEFCIHEDDSPVVQNGD